MSRSWLIESWNFNFNGIRRKENVTTAAQKHDHTRSSLFVNGLRDTSSNNISETHAALRKKVSGEPVDRFTSPCGTNCRICWRSSTSRKRFGVRKTDARPGTAAQPPANRSSDPWQRHFSAGISPFCFIFKGPCQVAGGPPCQEVIVVARYEFLCTESRSNI